MNTVSFFAATLALFGFMNPEPPQVNAVEANADDAAIRQACLDYVDGFYSADPERVERGVHPSLQKVVVRTAPWGVELLEKMDRHTLVEYTRLFGGEKPTEERKISFESLAVRGNIATVIIDSAEFIDFAHVAKINGEWRLINVLWAPHVKEDSGEASPADLAAIEQAGLDYVDGFLAGSVERLERALHPRLQKVMVQALPNGREMFRYTSTDGLIEYARSGLRTKPEEERKVAVTVHRVFEGIATITIDSADFLDYAHVARIDGKWKIVNVLWAPR